MYGLPDRLRPLSAAEEQVMLAVWACREPATRRDIDEKLRSKGWAPATVLNFLYRLEEKGWVKSDKKPALNPDLWERLLELEECHTLRYHWVKGHADNVYNNRCDAMAVAEWQKLK